MTFANFTMHLPMALDNPFFDQSLWVINDVVIPGECAKQGGALMRVYT